MKNTLTHKENKETVFTSLGRLKIAIQSNNQTRSLNLLNKITNDVSKMDLDIMHCHRDLADINDFMLEAQATGN